MLVYHSFLLCVDVKMSMIKNNSDEINVALVFVVEVVILTSGKAKLFDALGAH